MANLITELTPQYCNEMLVGAMFMYKGEPHQFQATDEATKLVRCKRFVGNADKVTTKVVDIPNDHFAGWAALEFPILGYRMAGNGQALAYLTRRNSVRRGLVPDDVRIEFHDVSFQCREQLGFNLNHYVTGNARVPLVMAPEYLSFNEGLAKILKGEIPSFALSAEFAVAPHREVPFLEILYRKRRIGTIDANGKIEIVAKGMLPVWQHTSKEF